MAGARTDLMDTRKTLNPVVIERPARNREMISQTKDFSELEPKDGRSKETRSVFHEGYVGGQKYLVPDSNLEAMADMINLKMRRHEYSKYMNHDEMLMEQEADPDEHYQKRGEKMLKKIDNLADDSDEDSVISNDDDEWSDENNDEAEEEKLEELPTSDEEGEGDEGEEESLDESEVEEEERDDLDDADNDEVDINEEHVEAEGVYGEGVEDDVDLSSSEEPVVLPLEEEEKLLAAGEDSKDEEPTKLEEKEEVVHPTIYPGKHQDPEVKRFLISGHFRTNRKPIYIIQEYEGPSLFQNKNPEFFSHKSEHDADVLMRGEFFKESILEEDRYMQPVSLRTTPRQVAIDWRSMIFEEKFTHVFVGSEVDIQISGSFIEHPLKELFTPLISLVLRKGSAHNPVDDQGDLPGPPSDASVYLMRPIEEKPFEREDTWQTGRQKELKGREAALENLSGPSATLNQNPETHATDRSRVPKYFGQEASTTRRSSEESESSQHFYKLRDSMRETLLLPETSLRRAHGGSGQLADLDPSLRRRHIQRSLASEDSPTKILEAFVRTEGEKRRERRRNERQRTLGSVLSRFFSSK